MTQIRIKCYRCHAKLKANTEDIGYTMKCPGCKGHILVSRESTRRQRSRKTKVHWSGILSVATTILCIAAALAWLAYIVNSFLADTGAGV